MLIGRSEVRKNQRCTRNSSYNAIELHHKMLGQKRAVYGEICFRLA